MKAEIRKGVKCTLIVDSEVVEIMVGVDRTKFRLFYDLYSFDQSVKVKR